MKSLLLVVFAISWSRLAAPRGDFAPLSIETRLSTEYESCVSLSGGVIAVLRRCAAREYAGLRVKLGATWFAAIARMPNDRERSRLRRIQDRWMKGRWRDCRKQAALTAQEGGPLGRLVYQDCQLKVIAQRLSWLEAYRPEPPEAKAGP